MKFSHKTSSEIVQYLLGHANSPYKWEIVWTNVIIFSILHVAASYGFYLFLFKIKWVSYFLFFGYAFLGGIGVTGGVHRLWAHKTYKATTPLKYFLIILNSIAFQNHAYEWCRDHRLHHKFAETDADPHNAKRGFFFSHIGWLLVRKHDEVKIKGKTIDMSDLKAEPVIVFQKKYHNLMGFVFTFLIPFSLFYFWMGEPIKIAFFAGVILRYIYSLHVTWTVNSLAHMFGSKPFNKEIGPVENPLVAALTLGEGWHNYHHVFPWDYKASEIPFFTDLTTNIIDFFAIVGLAYDLKTSSTEVVNKRAMRSGDGSRNVNNFEIINTEHVGTTKKNQIKRM